jgi:hypothetical protein
MYQGVEANEDVFLKIFPLTEIPFLKLCRWPFSTHICLDVMGEPKPARGGQEPHQELREHLGSAGERRFSRLTAARGRGRGWVRGARREHGEGAEPLST